MCSEVQPIDVTDSADLLELAEEVRRSGVGRLLKRGEQELALLTPVNVRRETRPEQPRSEEPDALLSIIGIGESVGPTDVARHDAKAVLQGLRESRGALRGVDTEALLADLAEQRSQDPSRRSGQTVVYLLDSNLVIPYLADDSATASLVERLAPEASQ